MDGRVSQKKIFLDDFCSPKVQFALARKKLKDILKNESKKKIKENLKFKIRQRTKINSIKASKILNDELFLSSHFLYPSNPLKTQPNDSIRSITYYLKNEAKILNSFKQNNIYDIKLRDLINQKMYKLPSSHKDIIFRNTEIKSKLKSKSMQKMRKTYDNRASKVENLPSISKNLSNKEIVFVITKKKKCKIS